MGSSLSFVSTAVRVACVACVAVAGGCRSGSSGGTGSGGSSPAGGNMGAAGTAGTAATGGATGSGTGGGGISGAAGAAGTSGGGAGRGGTAGSAGAAGVTGAAGSAGGSGAGGVPASTLFGVVTKYAVSMQPTALAAGDVNGDGRPDLVAGSCTFDSSNPGPGMVSVFINSGNGTFAPGVRYLGSASPFGITVADLDGDDRLDIAIANRTDGCITNEGGDVTVLLNEGTGTFAMARHYAPGARPNAIAASDLDGDGDNDLAVANFGSGSEQTELLDGGLTILINPGNGVFGTSRKLSAGVGPAGVAAGDMDGDGDNDLAVSNYGYSGIGVQGLQGVNVFRNDGSAGFTRTTVAALYGPGHVELADVDEDRDLDMLVVNPSGISLIVSGGDGTSFTPATANFAGLAGGSSAVAPDLNGDGRLDVVVSGWAGTHTLIGNGSGGFATQMRLAVPVGEAAGDVVTGDFDGDGKPDLAFVTNQGLYVALNGR